MKYDVEARVRWKGVSLIGNTMTANIGVSTRKTGPIRKCNGTCNAIQVSSTSVAHEQSSLHYTQSITLLIYLYSTSVHHHRHHRHYHHHYYHHHHHQYRHHHLSEFVHVPVPPVPATLITVIKIARWQEPSSMC